MVDECLLQRVQRRLRREALDSCDFGVIHHDGECETGIDHAVRHNPSWSRSDPDGRAARRGSWSMGDFELSFDAVDDHRYRLLVGYLLRCVVPSRAIVVTPSVQVSERSSECVQRRIF
jgi:hypothetical protein